MSIGDMWRKTGTRKATFRVWRKQYAELMQSEMRGLRQREENNARLKPLVAVPLHTAMLQDHLG